VGASALLLADRSLGRPEWIAACEKYGFAYRIRLKGNLPLTPKGGERRVDEIPMLCPPGLVDAEWASSGLSTNIGFVQDKGHREPWFIAMNTLPSRTSVLDYSLRWSIETLFADYKTRGFGLADTHLPRPDRLARL
jgi:Transposase DDE domain